MLIERHIRERIAGTRKSILLLGPRQTGKSTLLTSLNPDLVINLARESEFLAFARNPSELEERVRGTGARTILVDEVQRLPSLTNTVQALIDEQKLRFFLSGSSARKLRRGHANLLPGRILTLHLSPLLISELDKTPPIQDVLETGLLPGIFLDPLRRDREDVLSSYASTYLREEIQAEALVKNIEGFSRFLDVAAASSGQLLDLSKLSSQAMVPRQTVVRFFEILEDTLLVRRLPAFAGSSRPRLVRHPKFYFFDTGVLNGLLQNFRASADRIGALFETLLFNQISDLAQACAWRDYRLSYYRTEHGVEVDFVLQCGKKIFAIEAKASRNVGVADLKGLLSFAELHPPGTVEKLVLYLGEHTREIQGVSVLPWHEGLARMADMGGK